MSAKQLSGIEHTVSADGSGTELHLRVSGVLDEFADFGPVPISGKTLMTVDLGDVTRCNSMGVMRWARFLKTVPPAVVVRIVACSSILLKQFNIYPGFLAHPNLTVETFQANYLCRSCDANHKITLKTKSISKSGDRYIVPPQLCPACRKPLELDGIPETLFLFIDRKPGADAFAGQGV